MLCNSCFEKSCYVIAVLRSHVIAVLRSHVIKIGYETRTNLILCLVIIVKTT